MKKRKLRKLLIRVADQNRELERENSRLLEALTEGLLHTNKLENQVKQLENQLAEERS